MDRWIGRFALFVARALLVSAFASAIAPGQSSMGNRLSKGLGVTRGDIILDNGAFDLMTETDAKLSAIKMCDGSPVCLLRFHSVDRQCVLRRLLPSMVHKPSREHYERVISLDRNCRILEVASVRGAISIRAKYGDRLKPSAGSELEVLLGIDTISKGISIAWIDMYSAAEPAFELDVNLLPIVEISAVISGDISKADVERILHKVKYTIPSIETIINLSQVNAFPTAEWAPLISPLLPHVEWTEYEAFGDRGYRCRLAELAVKCDMR